MAARRGVTRQPTRLEPERRLVAYAIAELGRAFTIGRLYKAFIKGEISKRRL